MQKQISMYDNRTLDDLEWRPGELIALDNTDPEFPSPLILAITRRVVDGFKDSVKGVHMLFYPSPPDGRKGEEWTLYFEGTLLKLWSPRYENHNSSKKIPRFEANNICSNVNPYLVEYAASGKEAIIDYLKQATYGNMDFYAGMIESGKLVTERSQLEKFMERVGLEPLLKNKLRFRGF